MQDNLINPQAVDKIIQSMFGSYEKFVLSLIERRKALEQEKREILQKLERIKKEETLIQKTLTGFHGTKIGRQYYNSKTNSLVEKKPFSISVNRQIPIKSELKDTMAEGTEVKRQKSLLEERLSFLNKEEALLKNAEKSFHGKKLGAQYFDSQNSNLVDQKPSQTSEADSANVPMAAIGELLSFKKDEYNQQAGKNLISDEVLYSPESVQKKISLQPSPAKVYQEEAITMLQKNYMPDVSIEELEKSLSSVNFDEKTLAAFKKGTFTEDFVSSIAQEAGLQKISNNQGFKF